MPGRISVSLSVINGSNRGERNESIAFEMDSSLSYVNVQSVPQTGQGALLTISPVTNPGYIYWRNMDGANFVDWGPDDGGNIVDFGRCLAGEPVLIPAHPDNASNPIRARADTAAVDLEVLVLSR